MVLLHLATWVLLHCRGGVGHACEVSGFCDGGISRGSTDFWPPMHIRLSIPRGNDMAIAFGVSESRTEFVE